MPTEPPTTEQNTISLFILHLLGRYSYLALPVPHDPYTTLLYTFQAFTNSLTSALITATPDPDLVAAVHSRTLQDFYSSLPWFWDIKACVLWVKAAVLKHPLRRTGPQTQWLRIVELQTRGGLTAAQILSASEAARLDWEDRAYSIENLVRDPDSLWFFQRRDGLKTVQMAEVPPPTCTVNDKGEEVEENPACPVCAEEFDRTARAPKRAPCKHVLCAHCFVKWTPCSTAATGTYTCPLCRACIVCGEDGCLYHVLEFERALPLSMKWVLDYVLPEERRGLVLHGLGVAQYWRLREATRKDRVIARWIATQLGRGGMTEEVRATLSRDAKEVMQRVRGKVQMAACDV